MRILITGSREWVDRKTIYDELNRLYGYTSIVIVHGGARGADSIAGEWATDWGRFHDDLREEVYPADWERYGRSAGHRRNAEMVALGADLCLAFPIGESRGTRGCIKAAEKAGIPVKVVEGAT